MNIPRQEALLVAALVALVGLALLAARLLRARRHGLSIRMQVFLALMTAISVVCAAFGFIVVDRFEARADLFAHRAARDDARVVADLAARAASTTDRSLARAAALLEQTRVLVGFTRTATDTRVQLLDERGRVLLDTRSGAPAETTLAGRPEVADALARRDVPTVRMVGPDRVVAAEPILDGGRVIGVARVEKTTVEMARLMKDIAPKVALLALLLAAGAVLSAVVIGRAVARPLERLTQAAGRVAAGERQAALPAPRGREVRALTKALESMRYELEQRRAIEQFAADLSHELKNPVASIRAAAEVLETAPSDPGTVKQFAGRIRESATKLGSLAADLLTLAQMEAHGPGVTAEIDLAAIAREATDEIAGLAEERRVEVVVRGGPCHVRGEARWLKRAIENLLSNAVAFSPAGGQVAIDVARRGGLAELLVHDQGPGVAPAVRDRLFRRFVTTRPDAGGTGLGLAIVQAVAESHGGRAELRVTGADGSTFAVVLPA